ncbi:MAG: DnaJ domain-containing protein [Acidobacteria bacterium]|nr:DnaJ domain-containing protein [Acidobacteriota bacterium]
MSEAGPALALSHLLALLSRIQRSEESGSLMTRGAESGVLVFERGLLLRAVKAGAPKPAPGAPPAGSGDPKVREAALAILMSSLASDDEAAFIASTANATRPGVAAARLNAADLILDLTAAAIYPGQIRREIPGETKLRHNDPPPSISPRTSLTASQGFLMSRADGSLTIDEIVSVSPLDADETLKSLYGLVAAGVLLAPSAPLFTAEPSADTRPVRKASALDAFLNRTAVAAARAGADGLSIEEERAELQARIEACAGVDHYAVLDVEKSADEAAIRRAYYKLAKRFHPDKHRRAEIEDLLPGVEAMFAMTTGAYNTLTDAVARAEYDREIQANAGAPKAPDADLPTQARESYSRARKHLEAEELFDALRLLETATQLDPTKADYWLYLGVVQTKNPKWRKKAEESFLQAIALNQGMAAAYLNLARLYKGGGLMKRSHEVYEKLLAWDPENGEALVELGRKAPAKKAGNKSEKKSFFGR